MASLHRQPGKPNWFCAYSVDGVRRFRSTQTSDKKQAWQVCNTWAKASALGGKLSPERAREVIAAGVADVLMATGQTLPSATIPAWFAGTAVHREPRRILNGLWRVVNLQANPSMKVQRIKTAGRRRLLDPASSATVATGTQKCQNSNQNLKCSSWNTGIRRYLTLPLQWFTRDFNRP